MNALYCYLCGSEISSAETHVVVEPGVVLCARCADDPNNHARVHPLCDALWHTIDDHAVVRGTRLAALRELTRLRTGIHEATG